MSDVYAMFSDQTACRVLIREMVSDNAQGLVTRAVGEIGSEVMDSADKAIRAAYDALKTEGRIHNGNYVFYYQFDGNITPAGASASLAFALKTVQKIEEIPFNMAATGIVTHSEGDAPVKKIKHLDNKIKGLLDAGRMKGGDMIFVPQENERHIAPEIKAEADRQGVMIIPITSVADAVKKAVMFKEARSGGSFDSRITGNSGSKSGEIKNSGLVENRHLVTNDHQTVSKRKKKAVVSLTVVMCLMMIIAAAWYLREKQHTQYQEMVQRPNASNTDIINAGLQVNPDDPKFKEVFKRLSLILMGHVDNTEKALQLLRHYTAYIQFIEGRPDARLSVYDTIDAAESLIIKYRLEDTFDRNLRFGEFIEDVKILYEIKTNKTIKK